MGFFKGLRQFGTGVVEGVNQQLPGLIEGQRRSKELQDQRDFQMELQNDAQDYTSEQSLLDRIGRMTTAHELQTFLGSASISGNLAAQDAVQARIDGVNRAEEMRKEQLTETDTAARERLTFAQGLTDQSQRNRDDRKEKLATAERDRQNINVVIDSIMMDRSGNRNRSAKYDLAIIAAEGNPGIIKRLRVMQQGNIDYMASMPQDRQSAAAAWAMTESMHANEWPDLGAAEKMTRYIGVLRGMKISNPFTEQQRQVPSWVQGWISANQSKTKEEFDLEWSNWSQTGGPGTGSITKQVSLQALQEGGVFGAAGQPPAAAAAPTGAWNIASERLGAGMQSPGLEAAVGGAVSGAWEGAKSAIRMGAVSGPTFGRRPPEDNTGR